MNTPELPPDQSSVSSIDSGVSRRSFLQTLGVSAAASAVTQRLDAKEDEYSQATSAKPTVGPNAFRLSFQLNGAPAEVRIDPAATLSEVLRHDLGLTGTKEICGRGACGGCSVMVDGKVTASCMMLAFDVQGKNVTTIEGMQSADGELSAVQEAFVRHDALQCGYCTPGFVIATEAMLKNQEKPTLDEIKRGLSGNFCRCGCHSNAFNAILDVTGQSPIQDQH